MKFTFHTSVYDVESLVPEVAEALEKRMELTSRRALPGLWRLTDSLNRQNEAPGEMPRRRVLYRRVVGTALIVLGLFILIPGLKEPEDLLLCLIAGICGVAIGAHALWTTFRKPKSAAPAKPAAHRIPKQFTDTADTFLNSIAAAGSTEVPFSDEGMQLSPNALITFGEMEYFLETPSGYLITWGRQATFLQKKDLRDGEQEEFMDWVSARLSGN